MLKHKKQVKAKQVATREKSNNMKKANLGSAIDTKMKEHKDRQQNIDQGKLDTQEESAEMV
eukprot:4469426-Ditylum_brightwellii.AAC.1